MTAGFSQELDWDLVRARAVKFVNRWNKSGKTNEKPCGHGFVVEFLNVFGLDWLDTPGETEHRMFDGHSSHIWFGKIIIEMKSRGADPGFRLAEAQIKRHTQDLGHEQQPALWMACDFENIKLWNRRAGRVFSFAVSKLNKHRKHFAILAGPGAEDAICHDREGADRLAAEKMARLHDELKRHGYGEQDLEIYLARLLFCLFANDTDIFEQDSFQAYIENSSESGDDLDARLSQLFQGLNEPIGDRVPNARFTEQIDAAHFKHINGGLFEKPIRRTKFDRKMRQALLDCLDFDWGQIRPAIFGSMLQGAMNSDQRRGIGAHYTSEENILKLINPLFMDDLRKELEAIKKMGLGKANKAWADFLKKLSRLKFLDPACGCGNFLIVAYRELRRLELDAAKTMLGDKVGKMLPASVAGNLLVNANQFYGIEIEEWPCQLARTGMWLMGHLMNLEAAEVLERHQYRLPLSQGATIVHANAHRMEWEDLAPKGELSYIMGNPPYVGCTYQSKIQKEDVRLTCLDGGGRPVEGAGKTDYVAAWYFRAAKYMQGTHIRAAFVSTNSITQGEQAAAVWKPLFETFGVHIDFACRTFKWGNEAKGRAAVHCVIVGFSQCRHDSPKAIYDGESVASAGNINPHLINAPDVWIESRARPLCNAPEMVSGNRPADGGHLIIEKDDLQAFVGADPLSKKYIRRFMMGHEFIHNKERHCLWLVGVPPSELKKMPEALKRVAACKEARLDSPDAGRRRLADSPTLFREQLAPDRFLAVPKVSSEKRPYIPIGYIDDGTIAGDNLFIVPDATLYHFGILTSSAHMAWTRAVCGRLEMRYRYSKDVVYNNFPWPIAADKQKSDIEKLAQGVLDARAEYPGSSLADLYDPITMPPGLVKAHRALDRAVTRLYGFGKGMAEPEIVAALMGMHKKLAADTKSCRQCDERQTQSCTQQGFPSCTL